MAQKFSKWFEAKVNDAGTAYQTTGTSFWHRFPDSHAARGALPSQPGDFMLVSKSGATLIEVKTSEVKHSLSQCCNKSFIDSAQVGHHFLWDKSGQPSVFIFMSDVNSVMEVWSGRDIVSSIRSKQQLATIASPLYVLHYSEESLRYLLNELATKEYSK